MTTRNLARTAAVLAALALFNLTPPLAQAAHAERASLFVLHVAGIEPGGPAPTSTSLWCNPPGGDHPAPEAACDQLAQVGGHVARIAPEPGACTLEYVPVRTTAVGLWKGFVRSYSRVFANRCEAIRETGGVLFRRPR